MKSLFALFVPVFLICINTNLYAQGGTPAPASSAPTLYPPPPDETEAPPARRENEKPTPATEEAPPENAEDGKEEEEEEEEEIDPTVRPLQYFKDAFVANCCATWAKDIQLSGYLDQTFTYNFNRPDSRVNSLRVFDHRDRRYTFNMLQLYALKEPTAESRWGFGSRVSTGYDADVISPYLEHREDKFDWEELYASYLFDLGPNGLLVKAGRMATLAGAEVIEQKDNWNISRSFLFGYAIPFTHTGVRANYKINDMYDFTFGVNRGWDTFRRDNNDALSYESRLGVTMSEKLSYAAVFLWGPEQEGDDSSERRLLDLVATYKFTDKLTGMLNADFATEEDAAPDGGNAKWRGLAAYLKYDYTEKLSYAWRGEVFQDADGARTGTAQTLWENTLTAQYKFRENVWGRLEFRHDQSNERAFEKSSGRFGRNQNTIAASVLITF